MIHEFQVSGRDKIAECVQAEKYGFFSFGSYAIKPLELAAVILGVCSGRAETFPPEMSAAETHALKQPPSVKLKNNPIDDPLFYTIGEVIRKHTLNINERIQKELKTDKVLLLNPLDIILINESSHDYIKKEFCLEVTGKLASKSESIVLNEGFRDLTSELSDFQLAMTECVAGLAGDGIAAVHKSKSILTGLYDTAPDDPSGFYIDIWFTIASEAYELYKLEL
ncbi:hypothetical protein [Serratia marcescens]|uniref:Uncharacterized protein n=1 Tax=Serratia marcescens TaxID=615 RepID=A0ABD6HUD4_SERMA|nr:hypothetical protein [Serratia marcescens]MDT0205781.1 hypothetical protein [Serratia marcescens]MVF06048.1 hypothetical protein [Serratia marcescens]